MYITPLPVGQTVLHVRVVFSEIDVYLPSFSTYSYLEFGGRITSSLAIFADIEIVFRASSADGLLLFSGLLLTSTPVTLNVDLDL